MGKILEKFGKEIFEHNIHTEILSDIIYNPVKPYIKEIYRMIKSDITMPHCGCSLSLRPTIDH